MKIYLTDFFGELIGSILLVLSGLIYKNGLISGFTLAFLIIIGETFYSVSFNPLIAIAHFLDGLINTDQLKIHLFAQLLAIIIAFFIYKYFFTKK
jgi:glycerol uptake facilitator-like aquaporin